MLILINAFRGFSILHCIFDKLCDCISIYWWIYCPHVVYFQIRSNLFLLYSFIKNLKNTRILVGIIFLKILEFSKYKIMNSLYNSRNFYEIFRKFLRILKISILIKKIKFYPENSKCNCQAEFRYFQNFW